MESSLYERTGRLPGSLELAYLGDALYELYVRSALIGSGNHVKALHRQAVGMVCAGYQARAFEALEGSLSPEERAVARRARNAHQTPTKNADIAEYHQATALEALLGYLYLTGQQARLEELLQRILNLNQEEDHLGI